VACLNGRSVFPLRFEFFDGIVNNQIIQLDVIVKGCASFEPRMILKIFLRGIMECQRNAVSSSKEVELAARNTEALRDCYNNVTIYNQTPLASLEKLYRDMASNRNLYLR